LKLRKDCFQLGAAIIFDLVYDGFIFDEALVRSPLAHLDDWKQCYAVNSASKNYGAPGLRVGWIIANQRETDMLTCRLECERICVSARAQRCAARLLQNGASILVERVRAGREMVCGWATERGLIHSVPSGGTQLWLCLGGLDVESFADRLMERYNIVVATGANYSPNLQK
jgi:aspartate aminotransferase